MEAKELYSFISDADFEIKTNLSAEERGDFFISSALRWVSEVPLQNEGPDKIDNFIDKHLWFLPIPRFTNTHVPAALNDGQLIRVCLKNLKEHCANHEFHKSVQDTNSTISWPHIVSRAFEVMWPHIAVLRDSDVGLQVQERIVCLMAIDPANLKSFNIDFYENSNFLDNSMDIILDEIGQKNIDGDILQVVSKFLDTRSHKLKQSKVAPQNSTDLWLKTDELDSQGLLSAEISRKVDVLIDSQSLSSGLSKDYLKGACRIKNIIDEHSCIAFRFE